MHLAHELLPTGRLGRAGFWLRHATLVPLALWATASAGVSPGAPFDLPLALFTLALLVSTWGRRLHDRGRSAWWLLAVAVPVLGALWLSIECALRGTSPAAARFGAPPGLRSDYTVVGASRADASKARA